MTRHAHAYQAKVLLVNYFESIAKRAGLKWDSDYTAEIGEAIDHIIDAASIQARDDLAEYVKADALR